MLLPVGEGASKKHFDLVKLNVSPGQTIFHPLLYEFTSKN